MAAPAARSLACVIFAESSKLRALFSSSIHSAIHIWLVCLHRQSISLRSFAACGREHDGWQYVGHAGQWPACGRDKLRRDYPTGQYNAWRIESRKPTKGSGIR